MSLTMANAGPSKEKMEMDKKYNHKSKDIIRNVYNKCKEEIVSGLQIPLALYEDRVIYYTGAPRCVIEEVSEQKYNVNNLDLFEKAIISDIIYKRYERHEPFSFKEIYDEVQTKIKMRSLTIFCRNMRALGYMHVNTLNYGKIVSEDPKFTFERFRYLNKIIKLRANKNKTFYYLDERIIDLSRKFYKPWLSNTDMSKLDGYIFFHIASKQGLEKGLFCNHASAYDLIKWISDVVLTSLNPSSVIIMDKSPLHGEAANGPITRYHSKDEMVKWLQQNNIPCTSSMHKAQLYDLIARCPFKDTQYNLDLIFKSHGHEVLRLPENYHDLSVTELMWEHVGANKFKDMDMENVLNLKNKIFSILTNSIPLGSWNQFETTIEATEKKMFTVDEAIEDALNAFDIDLKDIDID